MSRLWSSGADVLFGYSAEAAVGQTLDLLVPAPFRDAHWAGYDGAIETGHFAKAESWLTGRATAKDGRTLYVERSAAILSSDAGQAIGIMAIGRDVTGRHKRGG